MGVFATRSPFRPNPVGMSSVKIEDIQLQTDEGPVIIVSGIDMMNGTPIYDIKPYLPCGLPSGGTWRLQRTVQGLQAESVMCFGISDAFSVG